MKTLSFKTTIQDHAGVAAVTPLLNAIESVDGFAIDTEHPDHLLTVQTIDNRIGDQVIGAVRQAGYQAEATADDA